ncbi:murein biosynthesis integral membrane protein MurJ [Ornithinimicrobium flavum]|uniref:murein biosynthesis integral membrane protein MurJ n=1 Tax=Ornithinimicrobium flavum TaxID=1288636 RepID=UPI00106FDEFD|nr:murein biosynthesis integral membrane protein MurJ [Ornithinimicrobium flavum]
MSAPGDEQAALPGDPVAPAAGGRVAPGPGGPAAPDHGSSRALARSSAIMASGTLVSRVLGLVRMALLIAAVGAQTDAANVWDTANTIPNTIYLLLAAGVLNVVLLPQITRAMVRGGEAGQDYIDRLLTLAFTVVAGGTALVLLAAPLVTKLMALSWPWGGEKLTLAILFAYLCIPQVLFYGLHTILGQVLAAHHRFGAFMWSPALANVVAITGLGVFLARYGDVSRQELTSWTPGMIWLLAGSATLGILVQALVLIPAVRSTGFTYRPRWGFRGVGLGSASRMSSWAFAEILLSQAGMLVAINMLNDAVQDVSEAPGKAAHFAAFSTFMLPHSLIALSLLTAIFPVLTKAAAAGELRVMAEHTGRALRLLAAAMVPIAVGMIVLAPLVVRVINPTMTPFEHLWVTRILFALLVGLVPYGIYLVCARVFYAFEDARTPFLFQVALTSVLLVFCGIAWVQGAWWVAVLVGLGQAMGQIAAMLMGLRAVRRRLPDIDLRSAGVVFLKAGAAALVALLPAWLLVRLLADDGWLGAVVPLAVAGPVFVAVYAVLAHRLGVAEVTEVGAPLLRRIPGARRFARTPAAATGAPVDGTTGDPGTPPTSASVAEQGTGAGTLGWDDAPRWAFSGGEDGDMDQLEVGTRLGDRYALEELLAEREGGGCSTGRPATSPSAGWWPSPCCPRAVSTPPSPWPCSTPPAASPRSTTPAWSASSTWARRRPSAGSSRRACPRPSRWPPSSRTTRFRRRRCAGSSVRRPRAWSPPGAVGFTTSTSTPTRCCAPPTAPSRSPASGSPRPWRVPTT